MWHSWFLNGKLVRLTHYSHMYMLPPFSILTAPPDPQAVPSTCKMFPLLCIHWTSACTDITRGLFCRDGQSRQQQTFGTSMVAMGTAATLYHASSGKLRTMLRKLDYYTISVSTMAMAHSLHPQQQRPLARRAATFLALAVPLKPTLVTAVHCAALEVRDCNSIMLSSPGQAGVLHLILSLPGEPQPKDEGGRGVPREKAENTLGKCEALRMIETQIFYCCSEAFQEKLMNVATCSHWSQKTCSSPKLWKHSASLLSCGRHKRF